MASVSTTTSTFSSTTINEVNVIESTLREMREAEDAEIYKMKPDTGPSLAIIFNMVFNSTNQEQALPDMENLTAFLRQSWNFKVVQIDVAYEDIKEDVTGILKQWLARVFTEKTIIPQDDNYVFVGFFYEKTLQLSSESLWDGMVTKESGMFTRPKILFFQEYKNSESVTSPTIGTIGHGAIVFVPKKAILQPSYLDILSIHGFGLDYVNKFIEVATLYPAMELCDLLTNVHTAMQSICTDNCADAFPYYISTLRRDLVMINKSSGNNETSHIETKIKTEVHEAKTRAGWEKKYIDLQRELNKQETEISQHPYSGKYQEYIKHVNKELRKTQMHLLVRTKHPKHVYSKGLNDWFELESERIRIYIELLACKNANVEMIKKKWHSVVFFIVGAILLLIVLVLISVDWLRR